MTIKGQAISLVGKNETNVINLHNDKELINGGIVVWLPQKN
jgi:hypothetical protein